MSTDCSKCKYLDRSPHHSSNILCSLDPAYASMWKRLKPLDDYTLNCLPIDDCREFEISPEHEEKEISLDLTFYSWLNLAKSSTVSNVLNTLHNITFNHTLTFTQEQWQAMQRGLGTAAFEWEASHSKRALGFPHERLHQDTIANSCHDFQVLEQLHQYGIIQNADAEWIKVDSSCIAAIAHDEPRNLLKIRFLNGSIYQYEDFDRLKFSDFRNASSHGGYFNREIKDIYIYTLL